MHAQRIFLLLSAYPGLATLSAQPLQPSPQTPLSSTVNRGLPSWLRFSGEERSRVENLSGVGFKDVIDAYFLQRLRLGMEVRAYRWLRFRFEAQDGRVFGQAAFPAPASQKNAIDLRVGYLQVGGEEGLLTLRAGRLPLAFGEGRILADPGWSNVGRTFDAARLTVRKGLLTADLFSGAVVKIDTMGCDQPVPGAHLHGIYTALANLIPDSSLEPYVLWRLEHEYLNEAGQKGHYDLRTFGVRFAGKLPYRFDYGIEVIDQSGANVGNPVRAWAGHWALGYTLANQRFRPRLFSEYNRASGDANSRDGIRGGFDPLYPSTHDKLGLTDVFTWTNLVHWRTGLGWTVRRGVTAAVAYNSYWLADPHDGLWCGGKVIARRADGSAGTHIGQQADFQATWAPSRSTQFQAGYGRLFPSRFLHQTSASVPYDIVFLNIAQRF